MGFSFIHASDIHLGRAFSGLSLYLEDEDIKKIYKSAVEKAFNNLIKFAISKSVDFVLIAGDTFDDAEQDFASKIILKNGLQQLENAGIKVFLICGNHDCLSSYNKNTFNFEENSIVKIIGLNTKNNAELVIKNNNGNDLALLHAISYEKETFYDNPAKYLTPAQKGIFNIGLIHCDMDGNSDSPYGACKYGELNELNYDYFALGHIHIPDKTQKNIAYSGTLQGRNSKETGAHGIKYIKVDKGNIIENQFIPLDVMRYDNIEIDVTQAKDITQCADIIAEKTDKEAQECELYLIKVVLTGLITFSSEINEEFYEKITEKIKSDTNNRVIISEITNKTNIKYNEEMLCADEGISGKIYNTVKNPNKTEKIYAKVAKELEKMLKRCDFSDSAQELLSKEITNSAVQKCLNIANSIYESEYKEN